MPAAAEIGLRPTVLFVDDDIEALEGYRNLLRKDPYEILGANGGSDALSVLRERAVDIVISDERMPSMTGTAFLAQVQSEFPHTVRILLTGHASLNVAVRAINRGFVFRFLEKPCPPTALREALADAWEERQRRANRARELNRAVCAPLSERELEVVDLLTKGHRVKSIANTLCLSEHTIRNHIKSVYRKLDVHSHQELINTATQG